MTQKQHVKRWIDSAERNLVVARSVYKLKHYDWSLFLWQLVLEKYFKAILQKKDLRMMYVHDLTKLAVGCGKALSEAEMDELDEISLFNMDARYENEKDEFYKRATKRYADKWLKICEKWLKILVKELENE